MRERAPLRKPRPRRARRPRPPRSPIGQQLLNAPNIATYVRMALIPVFVAFMLAESRRNNFWAAVVFGLASATDFVDGYLARRLNQITTFGKFLDPLADKLITMSAYVVLVHLARLPAWVVIVILAREFIITGLRTIAIGEGIVIAAGQGGKWKTSLQLAGLAALIVHYRYPIDFLVVRRVVDFHVVGLWITYLSLVPSILSAVEYFRGFLVAAAGAKPPDAAPPDATAPAEGGGTGA